MLSSAIKTGGSGSSGETAIAKPSAGLPSASGIVVVETEITDKFKRAACARGSSRRESTCRGMLKWSWSKPRIELRARALSAPRDTNGSGEENPAGLANRCDGPC